MLACTRAEHMTTSFHVHVYAFMCELLWGFEGRVGPIDRPVRGVVACSSRSGCPLSVKDTDVTALIREAGSQCYKLKSSIKHFSPSRPLGWTVLQQHNVRIRVKSEETLL